METVTATRGVVVTGLRGAAGTFRHLALPLSPGLHALYGLNGSGKTTALRIARSAAGGLSTPPDSAHIAAEVELGSPLGRRIVARAGSVVHRDDVLSNQLPGGHWRRNADHLTADDLQRVLGLAVDHWFATGADAGAEVRRGLGDFSVRSLDIREELLQSRTFIFAASGGVEPRWDVWLAVPAEKERYPVAWAEIDRALGRIDECSRDTDPSAPSIYGWQDIVSPAWGWIWRSDNPAEAIDTGVFSPHWCFARDGLPYPMVFLGSLVGEPPIAVADVDEISSVSDATTSALIRYSTLAQEVRGFARGQELEHELCGKYSDTIGALTVDGVRFAPALERAMASWSAKATNLYRGFLQDARPLDLRSGNLRAWLQSEGLSWSVGKVRIDMLSRAQRRWARWAVFLAVSEAVDLVLIDEPESALHRSAEDHLARALAHPDLARQPWVVATHSPMIMDMAGTQCIEVAQEPTVVGGAPALVSTARPLGAVGLESLENLGMQPSDLLRRDRVFVLVEGQHDEIVLRTLIGDSIDSSRARILPLRGGSRLKSAVDGSFLAHYTNAYLVAVLDNLDAEVVDLAWEAAQVAALDSPAAATEQLLKKLPRRVAENKFMVEFLTTVLRTGIATRAVPYGLKAKDIIEYLPVDKLVPRGPADWPTLRDEHERTASAEKRPDFKKWLTQTYGARFSADDIRRAAMDLTRVPEEIEQLALKIDELGGRPPLNSPG